MIADISSSPWRWFLLLPLTILVIIGYLGYQWFISRGVRSSLVLDYLRNPQAHSEWVLHAGERCGEAPFSMPTTGFIGYLWGDSFRPGHNHQGIDIFGGADLDEIPVVAAYSGYLTRLVDWKASLIIRIPQDPLRPDRQIWTYYTHMADPQGNTFISAEFPPGTIEMFVETGTSLGYQGNYSGDPFNPTGVHLHFSIVKDDGSGKFLNELDIRNTLDPSPYFDLSLNGEENQGEIPLCKETIEQN
jgi:hypothetical protein